MARYVQERSIRTRATVVAAAGERFAAAGFTATAVADVASEAGISTGTLLFHFPAKVGIGVAVCQEADDLTREILTRGAPAGISGAIESLSRWAEEFASNAVLRAGIRLYAESATELGLMVAGPQRILFEYVNGLIGPAQEQGAVPAEVDVKAMSETIVAAFAGAWAQSSAVSGGRDLPERVARMWPTLTSQVSA